MDFKKYVDLHNNQIYSDKNKFILELYQEILKSLEETDGNN